MKKTVDLIKAEGLSVMAIVGGAPVSREYASEVGADAYAYDGISAVEHVKKLLGIT